MDENTGIKKRSNPIESFFSHGTVRTNPFGENRSAARTYERCERISAALYLLTSHLPEEDTLKCSARSHAVSLMDAALTLRDEMRSLGSSAIVSFRAEVRLLISLVRMLAVSGSVSPQNAGIIVESLDDLGNFIVSSQRSVLSESVPLTREDLEAPAASFSRGVGQRPRRGAGVKDVSDMIRIKDTTDIKDRSSAPNSPDEGGLSARQRSVLEVMRSGGELGIRDISSNLPQYSEKMVQRELSQLVSLGLLKKIGLKRWSRYSIAPSG
ncbi:MAG: hypothetical protein NUV59_00990, partial [Patescibacteria group bacterium]|nr:hypothetical protein [Patescibacteria group bacterium]